jgi:hypothetical protein
MTYDIEVVLRDRDYAVTRRVVHEGHQPAQWTKLDVEQVLKAILLAIDCERNPDVAGRYVALRGFSWIAESTADGVVIAIEIPSGAAVAGPFDIPQPSLDQLIRAALASAAPQRPVVH